TLLAAAAQALIAFVPHAPTVAVCLLASGMSWLGILSTINTAIQLSVPSWVKARAFGTYHMAWGGSMALGAAFWGGVAQRLGLSATFALSAVGMVVALAFLGRLRITALDEDLDLSHLRPAPHPPSPIAPEAGPILVQMEYRIPADRRRDFQEAMREVRHLRLRDGAMRWALFEDPDAAGEGFLRFVESYLSSSWGEHLRQHHRATMADQEIFAAAYRLDPEGRPRVRHLVAAWEDLSLLDRIWE
ncbi:MAG TPA: MFS transporter, partial [Holophagaceae bacterium]|nr:MFS transporter [Holophagaceae bacterium]